METIETNIASIFYQIPVYLHDKNKKKSVFKKGHVCLAIDLSGKKIFKFAASFKEPFDEQNFTFGKKIATGRLISGRKCVYNVKVDVKKPLNEEGVKIISDAALQKLLETTRIVYRHGIKTECPAIPNWLNEAYPYEDLEMLEGNSSIPKWASKQDTLARPKSSKRGAKTAK